MVERGGTCRGAGGGVDGQVGKEKGDTKTRFPKPQNLFDGDRRLTPPGSGFIICFEKSSFGLQGDSDETRY